MGVLHLVIWSRAAAGVAPGSTWPNNNGPTAHCTATRIYIVLNIMHGCCRRPLQMVLNRLQGWQCAPGLALPRSSGGHHLYPAAVAPPALAVTGCCCCVGGYYRCSHTGHITAPGRVVVLPSAPVPAGIAKLGLHLEHDFATVAEADALVAAADSHMQEQPYLDAHYDSIISNYRECSIDDFSDYEDADAAVRRIRLTAWKVTEGAPRRGSGVYPHAQVIDMPSRGRINAHRDNLKLFGEFTAGLNLLSTAVIRFRRIALDGTRASSSSPPVIDAILQPRTLYVMHRALRWEYTHEILNQADSLVVCGTKDDESADQSQVGPEATRRISVIVRDSGTPGFFGSVW
jgi:hypothetical protein